MSPERVLLPTAPEAVLDQPPMLSNITTDIDKPLPKESSEAELWIEDYDKSNLERLREEYLNQGNLDEAVYIDEYIRLRETQVQDHELENRIRKVIKARPLPQTVELRRTHLQSVYAQIRSPQMRHMLQELEGSMVLQDWDTHRATIVSEFCNSIAALDRNTQVSDENIDRYISTDSQEKLSAFDRATVNATRVQEILLALLETEQPDLRDLEFVNDVVTTTKNKFLRNIALKKCAALLRSIPNQLTYTAEDGSQMHPSITDLYQELNHMEHRAMPKRDFLFTLPMIIREGKLQTRLLDAVVRHHDNNPLRKGSRAESIYFSAAVDLFEPESNIPVTIAIDALATEYEYTDSQYYRKLQQKNLQRREQGQPELDQYLQLSELKEAYREMQHKLVMEHDPNIYRVIASSDISDTVRNHLVQEQFAKIWPSISSEQKRTVWDQELTTFIEQSRQSDLSANQSFVDILKKLSAIKVANPEKYQHIGQAIPTLELLNSAADKAQIEIASQSFRITPDEHKVLQQISNIPGIIDWDQIQDRLPQLYRQEGNFNLYLILLTRYQQGVGRNVSPAVLRNNAVPLFKEAFYHLAKGDFTNWRSQHTESINGNPFNFRKEDGVFWNTWNEDTESNSFQAHQIGLRDIDDPVFHKLSRSPAKHLLQPKLWKEPLIQQIMNSKGEPIEQKTTRLQSLIEELESENPQTFKERYGIQLNAKAEINRIKNQLRAAQSLTSLAAFFEDPANLQQPDAIETISRLYKTVEVDKYLQGGETQQSTLSFKLLKGLGTALGEIKKIQKAIAQGELTVTDSSDPSDLFAAGQESHTLINCMSYEGDPNKNVYLLDIATSKNKKVLLVKHKGQIVARAVAKILRDSESDEAKPIVVVDDILSEQRYNYRSELTAHLQQKFSHRPDVQIGEGKYYSIKQIRQLREIALRYNLDEPLTKEEEAMLEQFELETVLAHATGSRVSAELVETAPPERAPVPTPYAEPKRSSKISNLSAFYTHFVKLA